MDMDIGIADGIVVHVAVGLVLAVGPGGDLLAKAPGGVGDRVIHRGPHGPDSVALDQLLQSTNAQLRGSHLGAQVSNERGGAVVHAHHVGDVATLDPAVVELDGGETHALGPDVDGLGVVATGHAAPRIGMMALDRRDQHEFAIDYVRREHVVVG